MHIFPWKKRPLNEMTFFHKFKMKREKTFSVIEMNRKKIRSRLFPMVIKHNVTDIIDREIVDAVKEITPPLILVQLMINKLTNQAVKFCNLSEFCRRKSP